MASKRRTMADLLAAQGAIEDPLGGDPRPGKEAPEPAPAPAVPAVLTAAAIPEPSSAAGDGPLSAVEQSDLSTCEAAVDALRLAFWAAGKALQAIRDGRLYRDGYATFEDYVEARWDMARAQAYRLIEAWPLAERLSPMGDKINERQIRELKSVTDDHGLDAAALVYETVARTDGVAITAAKLHDVVKILPDGEFDPAAAVAQIRAYLAGELIVREIPAADPVQAFKAFTARATKLVTDLQGIAAGGDAIKRARTADPGVVDQVAAALRAMADEIERA